MDDNREGKAQCESAKVLPPTSSFRRISCDILQKTKMEKSGDHKVRTRGTVNTSNTANGGQDGRPGAKENEKGDEENQLDLHIANTAASLRKLEGLLQS